MSKTHRLSKQEYENLCINIEVLHTLLSRKCMDCKNLWHPLVMTLDHRDRSTKAGEISKMRILDPEIFLTELNKCDVVCRNCHQIREYLRDMNTMKISSQKQGLYKYYARLVPWLLKGAMLKKGTFSIVPVGNLR